MGGDNLVGDLQKALRQAEEKVAELAKKLSLYSTQTYTELHRLMLEQRKALAQVGNDSHICHLCRAKTGASWRDDVREPHKGWCLIGKAIVAEAKRNEQGNDTSK